MIVVCCEDLLCLIMCYHWLLIKDLISPHKINCCTKKDWLDFIANTYQEYIYVLEQLYLYRES